MILSDTIIISLLISAIFIGLILGLLRGEIEKSLSNSLSVFSIFSMSVFILSIFVMWFAADVLPPRPFLNLFGAQIVFGFLQLVAVPVLIVAFFWPIFLAVFFHGGWVLGVYCRLAIQKIICDSKGAEPS